MRSHSDFSCGKAVFSSCPLLPLAKIPMQFCGLQDCLATVPPPVVGLSGLEPPTSRLSGVRSNRLSYKPILFRTLSVFLRGSAFNLSQPISSRMKSAIHGNCFPLSRPIQFVSRSFFTAGRAAHFRVLVEINGIEPLTSCLQSRRSPS